MFKKPTYEELERRILELESSKCDEKYRKIFDNMMHEAHLWKLVRDEHGAIKNYKLEDINSAGLNAWGRTRDEIIGKTADEIFPEPNEKKRFLLTENILAEGKPHSWESYIEGTDLFFQMTSVPFGEYVIITGTDISHLKRSEKALKDSDNDLWKSQRIAHLGSWRLDLATHQVTWTEGLYNMYGFDPTLPPPPYTEHMKLFTPGRRERLSTSIARTAESGIPYELELETVKNDGSHGWVWVHGEAVNNAGGQIIGLWGVAQDIAERKRAELALKESEERLQLVMEGSQLGYWDWNIETGKVDRNKYWAEMLGYTLQEIELTVNQWTDLHHPDDCAAAWKSLQDHLDGKTPIHRAEYRMRAKDGQYKWILDQARVVKRDKQGKPVRMCGTHTDITDHKQAEKTLRENEERFRAIFHYAPVGMAVIDTKRRFLEVNRQICKILGYAPGELIGRSFNEVTHPEDREGGRERWRQLIAGEVDFNQTEKRYIHKSGETIWSVVTNYLVRDEKGRPRYFVSHLLDISKQKQAQEESKRLEKQFQQAQKMEAVGRLAGGVAHDFNNMLSVIIGNAEMVLDQTDLPHSLFESLVEIKQAGERSADLTRQLLAFARKQTVTPIVLDLNKTVSEITKMLQRLMGENIELKWLPGKNIWPVRMDPSQIDQILANLCVNARDAIADLGRVTIETENAEFDETYCNAHPGFTPGAYALLAVSDDGCGMDAETLDKIFEPFFTTKESGKGTGLGLATVYGVVKQNNGFINAYSEPGHGTTIKIYLPRYKTKADLLLEKVKINSVKHGHETVLLVEDEPAILKMTKMMLESLGYYVVAAKTPGEAIHLAKEYTGEIHLLLTDVIMPEMNGRDLAKSILSMYPNLKRLFMSGYTADVIAYHGILEEGINFIQKPFSKGILGAQVRKTLDGNNMGL